MQDGRSHRIWSRGRGRGRLATPLGEAAPAVSPSAHAASWSYILGRGPANMELTAFGFEVVDAAAHMNQPERGNPFDERFAADFDSLATECSVREDVRAVLIVVEADVSDAETWALARRHAQAPTRAFGESKTLLLSSLEGQLETRRGRWARRRTEDSWSAMRACSPSKSRGLRAASAFSNLRHEDCCA